MAQTKKQHAFRRGRRDHDDDGPGGPTFTYLDFETPDGCVTASEFEARKEQGWPAFADIAGYAQETDNCEGISEADYNQYVGGGPPSFTYLDSELPYGCVTAPEFDAGKGDGWPAFADIAGWAQETDVCEGISEADWNEFIAWERDGGSGPPSFP